MQLFRLLKNFFIVQKTPCVASHQLLYRIFLRRKYPCSGVASRTAASNCRKNFVFLFQACRSATFSVTDNLIDVDRLNKVVIGTGTQASTAVSMSLYRSSNNIRPSFSIFGWERLRIGRSNLPGHLGHSDIRDHQMKISIQKASRAARPSGLPPPETKL